MPNDLDVTALNDQQIENLIENHRRHNATEKPNYLRALKERDSRRGLGLNAEKTLKIIIQHAKQGKFLSYKDLADASGANWNRVHYECNNHLWRLLEITHIEGVPMLSAIVVNKNNVVSGQMEPDTLKGFVSAARLLKYDVVDEGAFLREQQQRVFEWAASLPDA